MADVHLERLCAHHSLTDFSCGQPQSDAAVRQLYDRVCRDLDTEVGAVAAVTRSLEVAGLVAATPMLLEGAVDAEGRPIEGCAFYYQLLAVDQRYQRSRVLPMLLTALDEMYERAVHMRPDYIGALATPLCALPREQRGLIGYLERRGFAQLRSANDLWFAPDERRLRDGGAWRAA